MAGIWELFRPWEWSPEQHDAMAYILGSMAVHPFFPIHEDVAILADTEEKAKLIKSALEKVGFDSTILPIPWYIDEEPIAELFVAYAYELGSFMGIPDLWEHVKAVTVERNVVLLYAVHAHSGVKDARITFYTTDGTIASLCKGVLELEGIKHDARVEEITYPAELGEEVDKVVGVEPATAIFFIIPRGAITPFEKLMVKVKERIKI